MCKTIQISVMLPQNYISESEKIVKEDPMLRSRSHYITMLIDRDIRMRRRERHQLED